MMCPKCKRDIKLVNGAINAHEADLSDSRSRNCPGSNMREETELQPNLSPEEDYPLSLQSFIVAPAANDF